MSEEFCFNQHTELKEMIEKNLKNVVLCLLSYYATSLNDGVRIFDSGVVKIYFVQQVVSKLKSCDSNNQYSGFSIERVISEKAEEYLDVVLSKDTDVVEQLEDLLTAILLSASGESTIPSSDKVEVATQWAEIFNQREIFKKEKFKLLAAEIIQKNSAWSSQDKTSLASLCGLS